MLVPVLRGRAAVTLGHNTSLLGPDGSVTWARGPVARAPCLDVRLGLGRGEVRRPLMVEYPTPEPCRHDSVFAGYDPKIAWRAGSACFRASHQGLVPSVNMFETAREVSKT
jgi:hypothetical protein